MKTGNEYSVLFKFTRYDGEINLIVSVQKGETIEKAIQKKCQTKKEVTVLSKVLLNEWSYTK